MNEVLIKTIIAGIPEKPGIYQFFSRDRELLYVGKAKNLKKRVASYFNRTTSQSRKLQMLVHKIADIIYIIVDTESDALLLENNLIKKHQPRYNVMLKDDKTFPWICVKNERFPRVFATRRFEKDDSMYFGPYTSMVMVKTIMDLIRKLYPLRTCSYNLSEENINKGKFRVCLEYHLNNCKGPCEKLQSVEEYNAGIKQIRDILGGNLTAVMHHLTRAMKIYASEYRFEEAEIMKQKINLLKRYQSRSTVVNTRITNVDVFTIALNDKYAAVNYFKVINGAIIQSHNVELVHKLDESREDLLALAITEIIHKFNSNPKEIIVPFQIDRSFIKTKVTVPKTGDKKKLLELSSRNSKAYLSDRQNIRRSQDRKSTVTRVLQKVQEDLRLISLPGYIECFDNSNIQGAQPVASCVVFKDGKPVRSEYRHFNVKTVIGPDDYASMQEIVLRRYKRLLDEKKTLPDLIIIDGGKGQLNAALESLESLKLKGKISIIAIAKKLEEIYVPHDPFPVYLDKNSTSLKFIQRIRNEAHRFGIAFHRHKRSTAMLQSQLDQIKGVGQKTKAKLLMYFGDIESIKGSEKSVLEDIVGRKQAGIVHEYFHPQI
ncbi:MAG: excinuclease ABC subunit C [Bacteroidales bacterium]|nr:excinuclease ABC subunit C [Bacteroidales bacterium]